MTMVRGPVSGPELLVSLDRSSELPLHEQLERALREDIRQGRLPAGMKLPSTRGFAARLGVSRGVVTEAYGQLAAEGYLEARQGAAVTIARAVRSSVPRAPARSLLPTFPYHFHPGLPDLAGFPRNRWLRSLRAALGESPLGAVGYGDPRGVPQLREALAEYLARARGAAADPEYMLICTGFMQGFSLAARWLQGHGAESIAVEDPGWHVHRLIAEQAGLQAIPVAVDEDGIDVAALERTDAAAVLVTPAHQFPSGRVLSSERRTALVEWAERNERLIVEDDYDAEYRYDRVAVGALQGLAPERVLYIGSASKRLAPAMRLGWMVMPSWLTWQLVAAKAVEDGGSEVIGQLALCDFIARERLRQPPAPHAPALPASARGAAGGDRALAAAGTPHWDRGGLVRAGDAAGGGERVGAAGGGGRAGGRDGGPGVAPLLTPRPSRPGARLWQPLRACDRARGAHDRRVAAAARDPRRRPRLRFCPQPVYAPD